MKWLLFGPTSPYRGGIAAFNDAIASVIQKNHSLTIYNYKQLYPSILFPGSNQFKSDSNTSSIGERVLHSYNPIQWEIFRKKIISQQFDVILFPYWHPFFAPMYIRLLPKTTRNIMIGHNLNPHESFPFTKPLLRSVLNKVAGVITLGKSELKIAEEIGFKGKTTFHLSPIYPDYVKRFNEEVQPASIKIPKDKKVILFFGLIRPYKGLDVLLNAMKSELMTDVALLIVGEHYGDSTNLRQKIADLSDRVMWIDRYVSDDEVPSLMKISELVILPYISATSTGVLPIAYCAGKPVIVTNVGGLPELVWKDKTGDVIPPNDPLALTQSIRKWLDNKELQLEAKRSIPKLLSTMTFDALLETIERDLL